VKLIVLGLSLLFHVALLTIAVEIKTETVNTGTSQTTTGLTASKEISAARLIVAKQANPPAPEKSSEPQLAQQATQPKAAVEHTSYSVSQPEPVVAEPDVVAEKVVKQPLETAQATVKSAMPVAQPSATKQAKEVVSKPTPANTDAETEAQQVAAVSAEEQPTQPAQDARQASIGQQGDNTKKAAIAGQQEPENPAWDHYKASVFAAINAQKRYPKQARIRRVEGVVMVRFEINRQGQVSRYEIIKKAKSRYLNRSTNALFAGLHLPQPDASLFDKLPSTLTVPIKYSLN